MKESTKVILIYVGAGVVANMLLAGTVAGATSGYPMAAAGAEGLAALGGAAGAWKLKGKKRVAAAIIGGAGAGLLVNSIQSGALSPAPAKPAGGATPQAAPRPTGSTLPTTSMPVSGTTVAQLPGYTSVSGQVPPGSSVPTPNRPPTAAEQAAYDQWAREEELKAQVAAAQTAAALQQGSIPTVSTPQGEEGGILGWLSDQSGAAFRVGPPRQQSGFGGRAASFRR